MNVTVEMNHSYEMPRKNNIIEIEEYYNIINHGALGYMHTMRAKRGAYKEKCKRIRTHTKPHYKWRAAHKARYQATRGTKDAH